MGGQDGDNRYTIRVFTGGKLTAGTDANVLVTLYGKNGDSGERKLDNAGNNFERNNEDKFDITANDLGPLSKIKVGHDNSGGGAAWYLDKVIVDDVEDGATYEFPCDRWLADDEDDNKIVRELECSKSTPATKEKDEKKKPEEEKKEDKNSNNNSGGEVEKGEGDHKYVVHIFTGGKMTAGTDANVVITLIGDKGSSAEITLDNIDNNFEKNKKDVFIIKAGDIGKLTNVKIGHDNSGAGPAWFLDKVEVGDGETGTMYEFECNKWLADDEDDNLIVRELECSKTTPGHGKKKEKEEKGKGKDKKGKDKKGGAKKEEAKEDEEEEAAPSHTSDEAQDPPNRRQFEAEFDRLQKSLEKESTRIVRPDFKQYSPFIFSSLEPYYNTYTVEYILDYPDHVKHGYITRKTAVGLVDPEVSHRMDVQLDDVPPSTPRSPRVENPVPKMEQDTESKKEGSTRLPKWPIVEFVKNGDMAKEKLNWGDVPKLREELRTKYSSNAQDRKKKDFSRTQQDWTRMELGKLKDINEVNRTHMQVTCNTYLGTSAGSKAAVKSLAKVLE